MAHTVLLHRTYGLDIPSILFTVKQTLVEALAEDPVTLAELQVLCDLEAVDDPH